MLYVLENEVISEEISTEISEEVSTEVSEENNESVATTEEPKAWPEGSVSSFTNHALPTLVFGMLGIFIVLGLISIATIGLNKLFPGKKD